MGGNGRRPIGKNGRKSGNGRFRNNNNGRLQHKVLSPEKSFRFLFNLGNAGELIPRSPDRAGELANHYLQGLLRDNLAVKGHNGRVYLTVNGKKKFGFE